MAKDTECPKCGKRNCKDHKPKKGYYGLEDQDRDDDGSEDIGTSEDEGTTTSESTDLSGRERGKKMETFRKDRDEAAARNKDRQQKDDLKITLIKKGVRFYDKKGSGYLKGGKKTYD